MKSYSIKRFFLITLFLVCGCRTPQTSMIWPLQTGSTDIYQFYSGEQLPINQLAIINLKFPVCIKVGEKYYQHRFALRPGLQTIDLAYFDFNKFGARTILNKPIPVEFSAEQGKIYQPFYLHYRDLVEVTKSPNSIAIIILDITDDNAVESIIISSPYPSVRVQALELTTNIPLLSRVALKDTDMWVRRIAGERLSSLH